MSDGWIKLHRKIRENPLLAWSPIRRFIFVELLLTATHKERRIERGGVEVVLQPGDVPISARSWARELGVTDKTVRRVLNMFQTSRMIETKRSALGTVVSICNWEKYQATEDDVSAPSPHLGPHQVRTKSAHNKKEKKEKKESNKKDSVPSGLVETAPPNSTSARPHKQIAERMIEVFNHHLGDTLSRARVTQRRVRTLSIALKDDFADDGGQWSAFCQRVAASDFLTGRKTDWRASLDWIIKPANRTKILEGNYDNRENGNGHDAERDRFLRDFEQELIDEYGEGGGPEGSVQPAGGFDRVGEGFEPDGQGETALGRPGDGEDLFEV